MGRSRRRQRRAGMDEHDGNRQPPAAGEPVPVLTVLPVLTEPVAPTYVPMRGDHPLIVAPVLELEGLDPWTEIPGPALALADAPGEGDALTDFDDPAQLMLEPEGPCGDEAVTDCETPDAAAVESATGAAAPAVEAAAPPPPAPPLPDPIEILYAEARAAADAGRVEEAKTLYRQLLALHPAHIRARNNLALLLHAEGNHQAALAELDRALDLEAENSTLLVHRGALLGAMGRYGAAERDLKKLLRVEPAHAEGLFNLGVVMTKKGLWSEAVPHLRRAVELEPASASGYYYLGEALNHVDDLQGALAAFTRAAELQPNNPRALYGLGIIYDRLGRPDDAAQMYRRSREVGRR